MKLRYLRILAAAICVLGLSSALIQRANADELYGRVRGVASDSTGAVLPVVQLKLTNVGTGVSEESVSGSDGSFTFPNLKPGEYKLVATKPNFKTFQVSSIRVEPNNIYVQNVSMELGTISETIEVTANRAQVEMTSMQLTATIDAKTITDLPLIGRNWVTLQQTLPGVVTPDTRFSTNYSTNGSQAQQNSYLVNGNDSNDLPLNSPLAVPNPDTIEEVKMVTNTINPEFGRNSGAVLNAITKSGTNNFHGTGFWFYRDTFLNTHSFFSQTVPVFHQNQLGGTVGGPVWKNKVFFFYGLQVTRARQPNGNTITNTVYTPAQLAGGFDPALINDATSTMDPTTGKWTFTNPNNSPFPMFGDANSTCPVSGGVMCAAGTPYGKTLKAGATPTSQPVPTGNNGLFSTGAVPTQLFNSLAAKLVQQFVPAAAPGTNQASFSPVTLAKVNQHVGRLDLNLNQKNSIWFYGFANDSTSVNGIPFTGATLPGFGDQSVPFTKQFTASWIHIFNTNVLNEFRLGYSRLNFKTGQPVTVRQPSTVGFPNIIPQLASGADYPQIAITGYFTLGGTNNGPQPRKDQTYQVTDNFSWLKGKHSFKFGYDGRKFQVWNPFANSNDGVFNFDTAGFYSTGDPGLDFLLGIPNTYSQGSGSIIIAQAYEHYFYGQDQWRVKPNLTVTLGAGYQIDTPIQEFQNKGLSRVCVQPGLQSKVFPTAPVGYTLPGDPGCDTHGGASTKFNHIGPRAGFAYTPNWGGHLTGGSGKTSIRGGFGLYFNRGEEELNLQDLGIAPFGLNTLGVADATTKTNFYNPSFPDPYHDIASGFSIPNKFPYTTPGPGTTNIDFTQFQIGPNLSVIPKNFTTPHSFNYNLTVERELPGQMIVRVGYVGAHGSKLITSYTFNPINPADIPVCLADPVCVASRASLTSVHPEFFPLDGKVYGSGGQVTNGGFSNYNSLQVTVEKHMSHGLQFLSAYSYSHSLDVSSSFEDTAFQAAGGVDPYGRFGRDYGDSAFDARHRWVLSMDYEIPSLKHVWSALPGRLVEGWRVNGINALQTGFPIIFQDTGSRSLTCSLNFSYYGCPDRPEIVSTPTILDPKTSVIATKNHYYFNPSAFGRETLGTLGNVSRGYLHGPGYWNTDVSLQKDTRITEGKTVQMRFEAYNVFNHTNFANPVGSVSSGNFGRISALRSFTNSRQIQLGAKFIF
ncbi:MAG: TonB-dependent receptor plug [Candidatus Acidoferrum typicum]|nr:TonB-dependent receptor plug [Candidatus Acidoferrum typicum]